MSDDDLISAQRLQDKKALKQSWLAACEPYKAPILFLQDVFRWMSLTRLPFFALFFSAINIHIHFLSQTNMSIVTLLALFAASVVLIFGVLNVHKLVGGMVPAVTHAVDESQPLQLRWFTLDDLVGFAVQGWYAARSHAEKAIEFMEQNPAVFPIVLCGVLLFTALAGTIVPGRYVVFALANTLLLAPGMWTHDVVSKAWEVAEPVATRVYQKAVELGKRGVASVGIESQSEKKKEE